MFRKNLKIPLNIFIFELSLALKRHIASPTILKNSYLRNFSLSMRYWVLVKIPPSGEKWLVFRYTPNIPYLTEHELKLFKIFVSHINHSIQPQSKYHKP